MDSIGNFLTIIRNGIMAEKNSVTASYSKMNKAIADLLVKEGFVRDVKITEEESRKGLLVYLKYVNGESVIHDIKRVSKPSRRVYRGFRGISPVIGKLGISIISTSSGVLTDKMAKKQSVGGEVICSVW
jgi:small subunit ribosomal protein S8